jgi:hypothetical protein
MGRTVKTTATTRAVITNRVPATLTTVYTNQTGRGAYLSSVNINATGDSANFVTSTGGSDWTHFGSLNPFNQQSGSTSHGFGVPYPVQLSDNRVLIFFLPHCMHRGGDSDYMNGNTIHTQILEYQTNKYVAGPITNISIPDTAYSDLTYSLWSQPNSMSGSWGPSNFKAIALTPTKVVFGYRIRNNFRLCRINITGNAVTHTVENLNLTGASFFNTTNNSAWDLEAVPGNTNKCVIAGWAPSNWSLQAFNIPDSGTLSNATSLVSTGIPNSGYRVSISRMVKTATANVTPFIIAASTSATAASAIIFNYNSSTDTWSAGSTAASMPAASSEWAGLDCACMSTGTNVNAVIAMVATGTPNTMTFARQTSSSTVSNTTTSLTLQHGSTRSIVEEVQWGDERAVFFGDSSTLVCYDSAGTATNLLPNTETTRGDRNQQLWFPFNSRPLYNLHDQQDVYTERNHQWIARTNITSATSTGISDVRGNYLPYGHDYGTGYSWHELANCWIVGQNGRVYALDTTGVIQSEVSLYELDSGMGWDWRMNQLVTGPSGRIYCQADYRIGVWPGAAYNVYNTWNNYSDTNRMFVIESITSPQGLNQCYLVAAPQNMSMHHCCDAKIVIEANSSRTERAIFLNINNTGNPIPYFTEWTGTTWSNLGDSGVPRTGTNSWHRGVRANYRLIQDTPCSTAFTRGLWRIVGSQGWDSDARYKRGGISNAYAYTSPGSFSTAQNAYDSTNSTLGYGVTSASYTAGTRPGSGTTGITPMVQVCAQYDETRATIRVWQSINGRMQNVRGWQPQPSATSFPIDNTKRWPKCTATKFGYSVVFQNTQTVAGTAVAYVFDNINFSTQKFTLTSSSGVGWIQSYPTSKVTWQHFGQGVDTTYAVGGVPDVIRFYIALFDGTSTTFYLNNGQTIEMPNTASGLYRSEDVYVIPPGYSLQVQSDTPQAITSLLSINENT